MIFLVKLFKKVFNLSKSEKHNKSMMLTQAI